MATSLHVLLSHSSRGIVLVGPTNITSRQLMFRPVRIR